MRSTNPHIAARAKQVIVALCICLSLSAQSFVADRDLFDAYLREDMPVWKAHIDSLNARNSTFDAHALAYEYGYCGFIVSKNKDAAKPYVANFRKHVETSRNQLPQGHYEMYMSAVLVYELRLHESFHPAKAMSLAKESTKLAPMDPLVLSYYGTSLFYAPKPFGSKQEALQWFEKADIYFQAPKWNFCWLKAANTMYIKQCHDKLGK